MKGKVCGDFCEFTLDKGHFITGEIMPYVLKDELREFIQEVSKLLGNGFEKAILYGSYARGDYNENSDIDIMILVNLSDKQILQYENQIFDLAFEIELKYGKTISPIIKNIDQFEYWSDALPFYRNVLEEGVNVA